MSVEAKALPVNTEALKKLISILCPGDDELSRDILLSAEQPETYFKKFEDDLFQNGVESADDVSFWNALAQRLEVKKCTWRVDWKDQGSNIASILEQLATVRKTRADWSSIEKLGDDYRPTSEYAQQIQKILNPKNMTLVWLDTESDSYVLSIVETSKVKELQELAHQLSHRILIFDKNAGDA